MDREECDICEELKVGFRFAPSPHQVLLQYLIPMIQKQPLPCYRIIKQADVYGASTPFKVFRDDDLYWQSASSGKKKIIYVFTKLSKNGKRVSRRAGRGTWVGQSNKKIKDKKSNEVLGSRGAFTYKIDKKVSGNVESDDKWCMYEYTLDDKFSKKLGLLETVQDYTICQIIKRGDDNASEYSINLLESVGKSRRRCRLYNDTVFSFYPGRLSARTYDCFTESSTQYDTDSSMLMGEVNQIMQVAEGVPNIIDTYSPMHVGEVNQIVPVAQGVPNIDQEP
ncbi:NAC domain-containing protein 83-like [Apium graveolens]|uniref:NAC domain-containing protein 83-like n=1 Tax=Apium graveolens TaxID=4045 RepID=UPI003D78B355